MQQPASSVETVLNELDQANAMVEALRASISDGTPVDLAAFNAGIETACNAAMALPKEEMAAVREPLNDLLARLDSAKADIEAAGAALEAELQASDETDEAGDTE